MNGNLNNNMPNNENLNINNNNEIVENINTKNNELIENKNLDKDSSEDDIYNIGVKQLNNEKIQELKDKLGLKIKKKPKDSLEGLIKILKQMYEDGKINIKKIINQFESEINFTEPKIKSLKENISKILSNLGLQSKGYYKYLKDKNYVYYFSSNLKRLIVEDEYLKIKNKMQEHLEFLIKLVALVEQVIRNSESDNCNKKYILYCDY